MQLPKIRNGKPLILSNTPAISDDPCTCCGNTGPPNCNCGALGYSWPTTYKLRLTNVAPDCAIVGAQGTYICTGGSASWLSPNNAQGYHGEIVLYCNAGGTGISGLGIAVSFGPLTIARVYASSLTYIPNCGFGAIPGSYPANIAPGCSEGGLLIVEL